LQYAEIISQPRLFKSVGSLFLGRPVGRSCCVKNFITYWEKTLFRLLAADFHPLLVAWSIVGEQFHAMRTALA